MKVLLLEDEKVINRSIERHLTLKGFHVDSFTDGEEAMNALQSHYDIYILDINVPRINGLKILAEIRRKDRNVPVIIITSHLEIDVLIKAYDTGCNEYLKKPFHLKEMEIRIDRLLTEQVPIIDLGYGFSYDRQNRQLFLEKQLVQLTKKELLLIQLLATNLGNTVPFDKIESFAWEGDYMSQATLRNLVKRIRDKTHKDLIRNIIGIGYMIERPEDS